MTSEPDGIAVTEVHLVGSVPMESEEAVFDLVGATLGRCCRRIPDGETGGRRNWIGWQLDAFQRQGALVQKSQKDRDYQLHPPFTFVAGKGPEDLDFGELGFARHALASYPKFLDRLRQGTFREDARFLVALPTPFAPVYSFTAYAHQQEILPVYEAAILGEIDRIADAIPAEHLAIQWDVATEMSIFEQVYPVAFDDPWNFLLDRLVYLGTRVPAQIDLGYHLCYGSMNNRHWKEPDDLAMCVVVANALAAALTRPIDFLHMPVPVDRSDSAYFEPLGDLRLSEKTMLFLGLVHDSDAEAGNRARMRAAAEQLAKFGIATECGLGRRDTADMPDLMKLQAQLTAPPTS